MDSSTIPHIVQTLVLIVPGFLLAITVHELSHAYMALRLGDPTAKLAGRITFNPISHLDPVGAIALVISSLAGVGLGWAKPVPVDPRYLADPKKDMLWISIAGPVANMVGALVLAVLLHGIFFMFVGRPVGSTTRFFLEPIVQILIFGVQINVALAIFNLLPVPPLDGAAVLQGLLPTRQAIQFDQIRPYGMLILLLLIFTGATRYILVPPIVYLTKLLLSGLAG